MKRPILGFLLLWLNGCMLMPSPAAEAATSRRTVSLDGTWPLAEGATNQRPAQFDHKVPVQARVRNSGPDRAGTLRFLVREAKSGKVAGQLETDYPLLAADTEFWRRQAAAVMHFCSLGYSRPDGQTSDHWLDVKRLVWEPEFYRHVRDAFAPVGLMVDFAKDKVLTSAKPARVPVAVINDLERPWNGPVTLRLRRQGRLLAEMKRTCRLESFGQAVVNFEVTWPTEPGSCQLEAELRGTDGKKVHSLRDTEMVE